MSLLRQLISACQLVRQPRQVPVLASYMSTFRHMHTTTQTKTDKFDQLFEEAEAEEQKMLNEEEEDSHFKLSKKFAEHQGEQSLVYYGVPYERIPVAHIRVSHNNTIVTVTNPSGSQQITLRSCGTEGFKNAKKGTSVAGQAVGIAAAGKALEKGVKFVRVLIRGLGPGRQSSIKGLEMGGLEVISITDNTPIPTGRRRPKKARRL